MNINIEKLKINLSELNKLIEDYEKIYYSLYNELSNCSGFWQDNNATLFFEDVNIEKLSVERAIIEFKEIADLYNYLVNKYIEFGNKIKFDLKLKDEILVKFDRYLGSIYDILDEFRRLDFEFYNDIKGNIYSDIDKLMDVSNILVSLKSDVKKKFNKFEEIEKEVSLRISKINVEILKENDISQFI